MYGGGGYSGMGQMGPQGQQQGSPYGGGMGTPSQQIGQSQYQPQQQFQSSSIGGQSGTPHGGDRENSRGMTMEAPRTYLPGYLSSAAQGRVS